MSILATASQIARALGGVSRTSVLRRLDGVNPDGTVLVSGNRANAWRVDGNTAPSLPQNLRDDLAARVQPAGCRDLEHLISSAAAPWQPGIPLRELAPQCIDQAVTLQRALAASLKRQHDSLVSAEELARLGVEEFRRECGYSISAKHWRRLFDRTIERDGGVENWARLETFLPDRLKRKHSPSPILISTSEENFRPLHEVIQTFKNPADPSVTERQYLWLRTLELSEQLLEGRAERQFKTGLFAFLERHAPWIAASRNALRVAFDRKRAAWLASGQQIGALADRRAAANAKRRVVVTEEDENRILGASLHTRAWELTEGWNLVQKRGSLGVELSQRYASTDGVPRTIRRRLGPKLKVLKNWYLSPRDAAMRSAYIEQDWSGVPAGAVFTSDDFTLEVKFAAPDGEGWWTIIRGQWLPLADCRSRKILTDILIPETQYTSAQIRTLVSQGGNEVGLPRWGWQFECGRWKKSKLVGGRTDFGGEVMNFAERLGLRIWHTNPGNAKGKIIEGIGKVFQPTLRDVPGWCGPNERLVKVETVRIAELDVLARRKTPEQAGLLTFEQWREVLDRKIDEYNARPQKSRVMGGDHEVTMSPDEAWETFQERDAAGQVVGLAKLPPECAYLLATHPWSAPVTRNGIKVPKSLGGGYYDSVELAPWRNFQVEVRFDPLLPDFLSVINPDQQVIVVPKSVKGRAFDDESIATANERVAAVHQYFRAKIANLRRNYMPPILPAIVDRKTARLGREMAEKQAQAVEHHTATARQAQSNERRAAELGIPPAALNRRTKDASEGLSMVSEALREHEQREGADSDTSTLDPQRT